MAEIPVITITDSQQKEPKEFFTRVFCLRKEPPPLSLLVDYLKARGATPIIPADVNEKLLNSWNWVGTEIGYAKDRKPILVTCVRKGGAQDEIFKQDIGGLLNYVEAHRELDNWRVVDQLLGCRFYIVNILDKNDITDEVYVFNSRMLQFVVEQ